MTRASQPFLFVSFGVFRGPSIAGWRFPSQHGEFVRDPAHHGAPVARRWLADGGLFFEQNQDNRAIGFANAADVLAPYFAYELIGDRPPDLIKGMPHIWATQPTTLWPPTGRMQRSR